MFYLCAFITFVILYCVLWTVFMTVPELKKKVEELSAQKSIK